MKLNRLSRLLSFFLLVLISSQASAQVVGNYLGDETALYAETKQVNQFFRRFNNEEGKDGVKYSKKDNRYRDLSTREKYLNILFDGQNKNISSSQKAQFISKVNNGQSPIFLDFHGKDWFAEVQISVLFNGKAEEVTLFLKLEQENKGYKWVMTNAYSDVFAKLFSSDTTSQRLFLHPMSHELDFMNLVKVFKSHEHVEDYTAKEYHPDYLSIFLYEFKNSKIKFVTVNDVKFHFFQVDGWYFELSEFNRPGLNKGWLISNLMELPAEHKDIFVKYIYRQ
ncbi:hypothetical protein R9C00_28140 [Flammeovirgaceae bacterium SG7u.111]|nr:hypothetical protein [Flammeovirgaceae bacterium SG7u.132]WPO35572.1 hypothetical protein R9C00_28140 [Flammeovirgaceae bacterium SG7u.111]